MEITDKLNEDNSANNKYPRQAKILIISLLFFTCIFAIALIVFIVLYIKKDTNENKVENTNENKEGDTNEDDDKDDLIIKEFVGKREYGIPYANDTIENTFKSGGKNYQEKIKDVNGGEDYHVIEDYYNIYDLYIPYSALKANKTKGILVFVHGGAWTGGKLYELTHTCNIYYQLEYIVVNLNYTLLNHNHTNIFRQIDEISACLENVKKNLINKGFKKEELQVAIGGGSAGGHLALLYAYLVKAPPLPVKFVHVQSTPVNLDIADYLCIKDEKDTLPDLEPNTVNEAIKKNKYSQPWMGGFEIIVFLMKFGGFSLTIEEIQKRLVNGTINKNDEIYKKMYEKAKWGFPTNWMEGKNIPILAGHGGMDVTLGFVQLQDLRKLL